MDADPPPRRDAGNGDWTAAAQPRASALDASEASPAPPEAAPAAKPTPLQIVLVVLGTVAFLYFARPVILPIFLACVGGMALKPLIRWLAQYHIPPALSAAVALLVLVAGVTIGFIEFAHPALKWMSEAPQHMFDLRRRGQKLFPRLARFSQAAAAVDNLGATEAAPDASASPG